MLPKIHSTTSALLHVEVIKHPDVSHEDTFILMLLTDQILTTFYLYITYTYFFECLKYK